MVALVATIRPFARYALSKTWMFGTSPSMTAVGACPILSAFPVRIGVFRIARTFGADKAASPRHYAAPLKQRFETI